MCSGSRPYCSQKLEGLEESRILTNETFIFNKKFYQRNWLVTWRWTDRLRVSTGYGSLGIGCLLVVRTKKETLFLSTEDATIQKGCSKSYLKSELTFLSGMLK